MPTLRQKGTRSRRGFSFRKGLKILLAVLLAYSLSSMLLSAVMFRVLFRRTDGLSPIRYTYSEVDHETYPRQPFSFPSGDHTLSACRYPAENACGEIVVINGIGAGIDSHLSEIMYFIDHGWSVVTWNATGIGDSGGRGIMGLQQVRLDLLAYLNYRQAQGETLPLVLYGHSAGAYAAATVLDGDGYPVCGAVCLCGFDSPLSVLLYHARQYAGVLADAQYPFLVLENRFLFGKDADLSAIEAINRSQAHVLVVESTSDDLVPHDLGLLRNGTDFTNPNVSSVTVDSDWRNEHNTPWLSSAAAEYVGSIEPGEAVDKQRSCELDPAFMEQVLAFFTEAVSEAG